MALSAACEENTRLSRTFLDPLLSALSAAALSYVTSPSDPLAGIRLLEAEDIGPSTRYADADAALALNQRSNSV